MDLDELEQLSRLIRVWMVEMTTGAGSGHLTSSLSAVEIMVSLMFGGEFRFDRENWNNPNNDKLLFSKGHASPLFYCLWVAAGLVNAEELQTFRQINSRLEGHPTSKFPFTLAATGSLGQGLAVGMGIAMADKQAKSSARTFVLMGDSELAEGSVWEAAQLASYYQVNNLIGIVDVNRLGQSGATMWGWDMNILKQRFEAFGWQVYVIEDGHDLEAIASIYYHAFKPQLKPMVILAKTVKGKGVAWLENAEGWHGKALDEEQAKEALNELGEVDRTLRGNFNNVVGSLELITNEDQGELNFGLNVREAKFGVGAMMAVREAYESALMQLGAVTNDVVVLDAEVGNSTGSGAFGEAYPERYRQLFIAEQTLVGVALGLAVRGWRPFVATFAAFLTRAFDQIRMSAQMEPAMVICGSHAGVSIGEDGASQMGLEDLAMMRSVWGSIVLYPYDGVSMVRLMELAYKHRGLVYLRSTRAKTPILYSGKEKFVLGGSKTLRNSDQDVVTLIGAGITLHECLKAYEELKREGILCRVIDLYSIKPIDVDTLVKACKETNALIVVEDHFPEGGIVEAVRSALVYETTPIHSLAVTKKPMSGKPEELLDYEGIGVRGIVERVKEIGKVG